MQTNKPPSPILISLILAEVTSVLIAVAMASMPSLTGSTNTLAHHFFEEPTFFHIALINYILVNIILSILAVIFIVWYKIKT